LIIISKPQHEKSGASKRVSAARNGLSGGDSETLDTFPEKLLKAVILFISKSLKLHTVIIDSVRILPDFLFLFGEALSTTKSGRCVRRVGN
jgi:hypothetical protein